MILVDVHAHLTHELFKDDLPEVIERAKNAGLKAILASGVNPPDNRKVLALAKKYDILKASLGIYPIDALGLAPDETGIVRHKGPINLEDEFKFFMKNKDDITAIGEVGIDYKFGAEYEERQKENFQKIIDFVQKIKKPMIVHSRKAEFDVFEMLESSSIKKSKVILHCFEGRKHILKKAADKGYNLTIPATIVRLQHFQILTEIAPITQLFTETDSPWLSPFPGKRNEPAFVAETIKKIAEIKNMNAEEVANNIYMNFKRMFE